MNFLELREKYPNFSYNYYKIEENNEKIFIEYEFEIENLTKFVGWDNFISAFKDVTYWHTWLTTLKLLVVKLPLELPFALLLAVILSGKIKGKGFFRTMYFMPNVVSIAILGLIVTNMFDYFGYINGILMKFHIIKLIYHYYQ